MRKIQSYQLHSISNVQHLNIPRRARVIAVSGGIKGPVIHTEVEDEDTDSESPMGRAAAKHQRHFIVLRDGGYIPGGIHLGSVNVLKDVRGKGAIEVDHVYEVDPVNRGA